jgi:hypothetical protein
LRLRIEDMSFSTEVSCENASCDVFRDTGLRQLGSGTEYHAYGGTSGRVPRSGRANFNAERDTADWNNNTTVCDCAQYYATTSNNDRSANNDHDPVCRPAEHDSYANASDYSRSKFTELNNAGIKPVDDADFAK